MRLWILRPINENAAPWKPWYDKNFGVIVRADSESAARVLAQAAGGDEAQRCATAWTDPELSCCDVLTEDGDAGVIMTDHHSA